MTTAEGGIAVTNDASLMEKMHLLRSHGITKDKQLMTQPMDGAWYYQQIALGFNYRMTELQAALGISQMQRIDDLLRSVTTYNKSTIAYWVICLLHCLINAPTVIHLFIYILYYLNWISSVYRMRLFLISYALKA